MIIRLKNKNYQVLIDTKGAQLLSFSDGNKELLHDGALNPDNPDNTWKRTAPRLSNPGHNAKTFTYKGRTYERSETKHGSLRNQEFSTEIKTANYVLLYFEQLPNNEFPFCHKVCVELNLTDRPKLTKDGKLVQRENPELEERVWIVNTAQHRNITDKVKQENMIYAYGQHPAFQITRPDDVFVYFTNLTKTASCEVQENKKYYLDMDYLRKEKPEAKIYYGLKQGTAHLCQGIDENSFEELAIMDFVGPYVIIWSNSIKTNSPKQFVCIEPWQTLPDAFDANLPKLEKLDKGYKHLAGEIAKQVILLGKKNSRLLSTNYSFGRGILPFTEINHENLTTGMKK